MKRQELTCLHTDQDGTLWCVTSHGIVCPLPGSLPPIPLRAGIYRVVGVPDNYRLITELYSVLISKDTNATLLVGSPPVCQGREHDVEQILSGISVLDVHNSLCNTWHAMNSHSYNNFLLLRAQHEQETVDELNLIYTHHFLRPVFQFLGLHQVDLAAQLTALIGDPRWYLNPQCPYRLDRLESYFGLKPSQFRTAWNLLTNISIDSRTKRTLFLWKVLNTLPENNYIERELPQGGTAFDRKRRACRLLLGFVARNWLAEVTHSGYFDPYKFFQRAEARDSYISQFRD